MTPYFLRFTDEAEAIAQLDAFRGTDQDGNPQWITGSHTHALAVIGTIYKATGNMIPSSDPAFPPTPEMAPIPGYHVNMMIAELPENLLPFVVSPAQPMRVFS